MLQRAVAAAMLTVALAFPLAAQLPEVQPGARVRVEVPTIEKGKFAATVLSRTADTLVLATESLVPVRIPLGLISSLEISRGTSHADGATRGMKWGASVMAGLVGFLAITADERKPCSTTRPKLWNESCGPWTVGDVVGPTAIVMVIGGAFGAGIGAVIGREHWDSFDLPRNTSVYLDRGRVGLHVGF
jgi:hypothetical protein